MLPSDGPGISAATLSTVFHGVLGIYVSNRCNAICRHCCSESGPKHNARLDLTRLGPLISEALDTRPIRAIHLTGGEPFLFEDVVRTLSLIARARHVSVVVNTNAFWAPTAVKARAYLAQFVGITELLISTDVYHEEFIPIQRAVNAATAAVACGLLAQINVCTPDGIDDTCVARLRALLPTGIQHAVPINVHAVLPTGRGAKLDDIRRQHVATQLPEGGCRLLNRPVVLEDGTVVACCNTVAAEEFKKNRSRLVLGDSGTESLSEALSRADTNLLVHALRTLGPGYLARQLPDHVKRSLPTEYLRGDICTLCMHLQKEELRQELSALLGENRIKRQVCAALALWYQEDRLLHMEG